MRLLVRVQPSPQTKRLTFKTMIKVKLITIDTPSKETNEDGSLTNYAINKFLNDNQVEPTDISAEYNELSNKVLVSIPYVEEKSVIKTILDFIKGRKGYQVRFAHIGSYLEEAHTVYIQKGLEDAVNYNSHQAIGHGIYVDNQQLYSVFLEYK